MSKTRGCERNTWGLAKVTAKLSNYAQDTSKHYPAAAFDPMLWVPLEVPHTSTTLSANV